MRLSFTALGILSCANSPLLNFFFHFHTKEMLLNKMVFEKSHLMLLMKPMPVE
jgi:hypothetical protein